MCSLSLHSFSVIDLTKDSQLAVSLIQTFRNNAGCCVNVFNNSALTELIAADDSRLWVSCSVETPGFCTQSSVIRPGSVPTTTSRPTPGTTNRLTPGRTNRPTSGRTNCPTSGATNRLNYPTSEYKFLSTYFQ